MICISEASLVAIKEHGQRSYPEECCGLILGQVTRNDTRHIAELRPLENRNPNSRQNRFLIEPEDIRQAEKYARKNGLELLGFYHSHPDCDARPSQFDLEHAWPWYSYIIVSIKQGCPDALTCWQMDDDRSRFHPVELALDTCELCTANKEKSNAE
ncbi:MAG: M67 family metallopeptidase [Acidobacteria bacterium]|nr:M67 family metallopeptidase [Acidobacteriota bacterium]